MGVLASEQEILAALAKAGGQANRVRLSQVPRVEFDIPYIETLLDYLEKAGLVDAAGSRLYRITDRGKKFLRTA